MFIPDTNRKPLSLKESVGIANQHLELYASEPSLASSFDQLMNQSESLFWEYPGHYDYPICLGWHPLGTA